MLKQIAKNYNGKQKERYFTSPVQQVIGEVTEKSAEMVLFPYHPPIETVVEFEERQHQGRFVRGEWIPAGVIPFTVERWIPINGRLTHVGLTHNATFFDGVRIQ